MNTRNPDVYFVILDLHFHNSLQFNNKFRAFSRKLILVLFRDFPQLQDERQGRMQSGVTGCGLSASTILVQIARTQINKL